MNTRFKLPGSLLIFSMMFASMFSMAQAQPAEATGTVDFTVVACSSISSPGVIGAVPADCEVAGGLFTFYLRDDGSADFDQLLVPDSDGLGTIALTPGVYEVVEETTQTHFDVTVTADTTTSVTFGLPREVASEPETVRLYITSLVCVNYEAASFIAFDGVVPAACTRVGDDVFTLYLYGDGTDDFVQVISSAGGPAYIDLLPGQYELVHEATQMTTTVTLTASSDFSMAFTLPAPVDNGAPTPTPVPATGTVTPTPAAVKTLPDTGSGNGKDVGVMLIATVAGAMLLAGANLRVRHSA